MSKIIVLVFSLVGLISVCVAQIVQDGQCATLALQDNFNMERFLGKWVEYARTDNPNQPGECSSFELTNNTRLEVQYSSVNNNFLEEDNGTVTQDGNTARLSLSLSSFQDPIDFWVAQTDDDYAFFAITYFCENISPSQKRVHIWVLTRQEQPTFMTLAFIGNSLMNTFGIELAALKSIDHSDATCYVLPIIEPGEPIILPGQCDENLAVVQNFDVNRFLGLWHQISSYETPNGKGACVRAEYTQGDSVGVVNVLNSQVVDQNVVSIDGYATVSSTEAKLSVVLNIPGAPSSPRELRILRTDYDNYAIAYSCVNEGLTQRRVYSWILSKSRQLTPTAETAVNEALNSYLDLNSVYYQQTDQSDVGCFFYPEPTAEPVEFRGQCESVNVQAMPNFEADKYRGTWHNIEMYPSRFQDGTCSNAFYELGDGNITVVHSQVNDQRLESLTGVAVAASDGSAKLVVTFPVPGSDQTVSTDYWVLDTDYTEYAFVYTCRNLDDNEMQVTSWKLSRTKELTPNAQTEIEKVMSDIRVLDQRYFIENDLTAEGCFYFPEPQPGVPVVFPGQCDEKIEAVLNFNIRDFAGTWHEIAGYPKTNKDGQCISQQFTANVNENSMRLDSISVYDLTQSTTDGNVTFASSDDLSGKLEISIWVNGRVQTTPYWILSTDYNDYALAYSCVNNDDDTRSVWSWKLSRSRQLSDSGDVAITEAIAKVDVLQNIYYEDILQTDSACFHLPDISPGNNVVLPGQCDTNIGGMRDFNLTRYAGEWRLIESYGSRYQSGTCNVALYTQQDSNTLSVTNSQVVNGQLGSISGTATITSDDGSGRLTFTLRGRQYTMYILETDYTSFALAYGCANQANNQRRVTSWKFSRSNTMSQAATDRINEIMNGIEVLHQPYYYQVDRSPYACFYFPNADRYTPVRFRGQCEDAAIPVVTDFDVQGYMGLWYDIESYPVAFQDGECPNARYTALDSNTVAVYNTHVIDQSLRGINGLATVASTDGSAKLNVTFDGLSPDVASDYWVLATDYQSYAFVYSCTNYDEDYMNVASWKLSRTKELTPDAQTEIDKVMSDIRALDQRYFIERDQTPEGCFYFPEPQPGVPVVFPGQCDDSVEAVPNFNMRDFAGTWHEIAGYPKANQDAQCISQQFTFNGTTYESMRLDSISVYDLTQSTTEGHVTFASGDDLSGKLEINIWVNGQVQTTPYWILSTDYNDYALAYSCVNNDDDTRSVWSWKLSRSRQLSDSGDVAITEAIAKVVVLQNIYYEDIQQTDSACFHLPEISPGNNVVLPGQCDTNIGGMRDFNLTRYAGEWRLIESYGSRYQSGTCNVALYTQQDSNTLSVTNSQVVNGQLGSISGTATITSDDGSGRLTFTLRGRQYTMYILETDYTSFALAYGCANQANNQRRVTSWKFSRSNTMSQAATDRINEIMNGIEVLHQPYYYQVDRSPYACFYFPNADRYTPVRFRGQCEDTTIPVVTDFDVQGYMGLWYDIESYPVAFQDGECPNARYTALDSNTVAVYNTHVIDQSLRGINGLATVASTDGSAKLNVTFDGLSPDVASDYWVLATDYQSYAFVYSCTNYDEDYMNVASWKLSRTKELTPDAQTEIDKVMSDIRALDQRYFIERDQTPEGCFYFPEPQPGVPVVFPGQCDDSVEAVPNFNMRAFAGTWHEIAGYPKANQDGQCINQQFTFNGTTDESMRLDSFSVYDLTQSTTEGHVTFASGDDLSGKLETNIWVNGQVQTTPYWILSTDYTDYALAYSCVNNDDDTRSVWSWKLSRSRQLSDSGDVAITEAIAKVVVLQNIYYEDIQQTDSACFHLPEISPGNNVVLPGQCDTNIGGMRDFNLTRYAGEWRLIESYGSRYQSGTCNVALYTQQDSNTLSVTNSQVVNGQLGSISGTATITSDDGSGRLTFTLRGRQYTMYILETDYTSFALAYGCANQANNQRRVTSWKFSRSNTMSQAATDRINEIMNGIEVLHQPYYYQVDRSPYACFYFPNADRYTPVRFRGQCEDTTIPVVTDFDVQGYMGLWYDIESYPVAFQDGECPNARYTALDSNTVAVYNTHVIDQSLRGINGLATVASTDGSAKLNVTFDGLSPDVASDYWVLATDYQSYAFVYSCTNYDEDYMNVASWKLSRTKELTPDAQTEIDKVMSDIRALDQRYFIERDQTPEGCFYFPEPQPGVPVVFPGQCDDSVEAVPNFNMRAFAGTWHEIAGYPKANQDGQCINQQFTFNGTTTYGSMRLDSFSVLDRTQLTTEGHVTFTNDDELSGKLEINIWVNGQAQTIPYWILSTDYTDYAFVYSCVNYGDNTRGVWSWKLSRTKQLSDDGNAAINDAIAKVDVLQNMYYEDVQQTDTACLFYPDLGPKDPVVFSGRCDLNISVLQSFDASRYEGRWRLIESYYSDFQDGTCNAATYALADNGLVIVTNSKVVDEQLNSITGSAIPDPSGSGKLTVTFPNSTPTEYWILDTDYVSYALIYTCVDLPNDQRRVWSWKLSRSSGFTESATNAINAVINRVDVLDARYYQLIDRTDVGCFYYPTPDETSNVIFPGQCDESIPVVQNFRADLYEGTWFDVESYPTNFQSGTCNTAAYTVNSDGTLTVQNTQVVNQLLQTVTGSAVPSTTDGSAKFDVTLTGSSGNVMTTKYWILATDYETYSFVYSCQNIDDEFREVNSWKLGKETNIPEDAEKTINDIIDNVQVLGQQYFVPRKHTDEACFYYPDNNGGDVIMNGQCVPDAEVPVVSNFDANAFSGIWHEVSRYPSAFQNGECTASDYALNGANTFDVIQTSVIEEEKLTTVTQASVDPRGVISINVNGVPFNNVYVLATDYIDYAVLYSCRNIDTETKQLYSWKLSKSRAGLSEAANNAIDELISNNIDLHELYYRTTGQDHAACFYYPVFDQLPLSIELPGPCDESITGVSNFNMNNFLGLWYEIARYPQTAQTGQCNRAVYTQGAGIVNVQNSQVINQALGTISGEATATGNDGQIEVIFNVGGETRTASYYVLSTDYTSYALLYSCITIESGERRRVASWKLSRTTELSTQADNAIEDIVSTTQGLRQNYYQETSQTNAACFYYPEFEQLPDVIELPGPCDTSITGVPNFDVNRFIGPWFEVARYPQPAQTGQCNYAEFENGAASNGLSFVTSQVFDESLSERRGEATVASSDGSGKLQVTFSIDGDDSIYDYFVLATDYTGFALLYTCADNPGSNTRRVGSWKLSRNTELSQVANEAINGVIDITEGLRQDYYQDTSQTAQACFHYPIQTGDRVVLPGQCDTDISAVESFSVARFANNSWYQIKRYDAVGDRSCIGTRLSFDEETRAIEVLSFEVVDEDLLTTEGSGRLSSNDGSGIFSLVMDDSEDGEDTETTVYILATDYDGYALAYSCKNINSDQRQVGAWQLSRGRTMTDAGNYAITEMILKRPELHEPYFNLISHTGECLEPSSAFLFKSSIILIFMCTVLQLVR